MSYTNLLFSFRWRPLVQCFVVAADDDDGGAVVDDVVAAALVLYHCS